MNPLILITLFLAGCKLFDKPHPVECREVKDFECKACPQEKVCDQYVDAGKKVDLPDAGRKDSYIDWDGEPKYRGGKW